MLNIEDIKLINKIFNNEEVESELANKLKEKISLVCEQIAIQEKAQEDMAKLQDKIVALNKVESEE